MCLLAAINPSADALGYIQVVPSDLYKNEAVQISFCKISNGKCYYILINSLNV